MLGLIKLKTLENPVKRMGRKAMHWEKIFVKYICDKALVCKIYKELLKCNNKQPNLKIKKRSGHLSIWTNQHMKIRSNHTSLGN